MPKLKEHPPAGKQKGGTSYQPALTSQQAAKLMVDKYRKQLEQQPEGADSYAADQIEGAGNYTIDELLDFAVEELEHRGKPKSKRQQDRRSKEKPQAAQPVKERPAPAEGPQPVREKQQRVTLRQRPETSFDTPAVRERPQNIKLRQRPEPTQDAPAIREKQQNVTQRQRPEPSPEAPLIREKQSALTLREYPEPSPEAPVIRERRQTIKQRQRPETLPEATPVPDKEAAILPRERRPTLPRERPATVIRTRQAPIPAEPKRADKQSPRAAESARERLIEARKGRAEASVPELLERDLQDPFSSLNQDAAPLPAPAQSAPNARRYGVRYTRTGAQRKAARGISAPEAGQQLSRTAAGRNRLKTRAVATPKETPVPKTTHFIKKRTPRPGSMTAQHRMRQEAIKKAKKAAQNTFGLMRKAAQAIATAAVKVASSIAALMGGGALLILLLVVVLIAAIASSPFGIFFAEERNAPNTVSVAEAVGSINAVYDAKLEELQSGDYDSIDVQGEAADCADALAVFAARYAAADTDGVDVATLDPDRVSKLTTVFWDMTMIVSASDKM